MLGVDAVLAFVPIAVAIVVSPGPDSVYTLTRSLSDGRTAGVAAALGSSSGSIVHTIGAVLGLSALLKTSAVAFTAVKLVGAGYLVYLGVQTLRSPVAFEVSPDGVSYSPAQSYRSALVINVLNPKVAVFFLAFLPQFVRPGGSVTLQLFALGVLFACLGFVYQATLAVFSTRARRVITERELARTALRWASGSVLVGFGVRLALERRTAP